MSKKISKMFVAVAALAVVAACGPVEPEDSVETVEQQLTEAELIEAVHQEIGGRDARRLPEDPVRN